MLGALLRSCDYERADATPRDEYTLVSQPLGDGFFVLLVVAGMEISKGRDVKGYSGAPCTLLSMQSSLQNRKYDH